MIHAVDLSAVSFQRFSFVLPSVRAVLPDVVAAVVVSYDVDDPHRGHKGQQLLPCCTKDHSNRALTQTTDAARI